jgi:Zinc carboxypeptidase
MNAPEAERGRADFTMPEFTRALRGFASARALGRTEHMAVFGPLLAARKEAETATTPAARAAAFDAARLRRTWLESIESMAAARVQRDGADRRALSARLMECAEPVLAALPPLEHAAAQVREAGAAIGQHAWQSWIAAVQALFDAADRFWFALEPSLGPAPPRRKGRGGAARALAGVLLGASALAGTAQAQHVIVRVSGVPVDSLRVHGFDVVGAEAGAVLVSVDPAGQAKLTSRGWRATVMKVPHGPSATRVGAQVIVQTQVYRDYDDPVRGIRHFIDSLVQNNPLVSVDTIGKSYEGRPMLAVKIGPKDDSPSRPNVLYMATYHAREWVAPEMALRLIKYLAAPPGTNPRVDSLVQGRDIWVLPVANPDGYEYTFTDDRLWRKTRSPQAGGAFGVDMNRNHRQNWGLDDIGSSPDPTSDTYRGPSPESEIEVKNIVAFHAAHPPAVTVTYHSYAGLLLFSPSAVYGQLSADLPVYRTLAGTNQRSAVPDNLPGSLRTYASPNTAWTLYTTNGEYDDWASATYGTLAFTPEMTTGYQSGVYYGFEFPDDETQLQQLFMDQLPFAIDALESARDPVDYVSPNTFYHTDRVVLESVSPTLQMTVPAASATGASIAAPNPLAFRVDTTDDGKYTRRLVSVVATRPTSFSVTAGGQTSNYTVLAINGAEPNDAGWTANQFVRDSTSSATGKYSWYGQSGDLRSPVISVPATADTVSLVFWTQYAGSGYNELPYGDVMLSTDGGTTFQRVMRLEGYAPTFYPEQVTIGGVKGKKIVFDFVPSALPWRLDEIAIVSHGTVTAAGAATAGAVFLPSENPVHHNVVYFSWPFGSGTGDVAAYDFSGHLVWKANVTAGGNVPWDLNAGRVANGVYLVIAQSGSKTIRLKLFVVRNGS